MILGVYTYYNKALQSYSTQFQMDDHAEKDIVYNVQKGVTARLVLNKFEDLKFLALYKLGTFNDETGEFVADKKLVLDLDNVIASYFAQQQGGSDHVGQENQEGN